MKNNEERKSRKKHRIGLKSVVTVLAAITAFITTYVLILPAAAWERMLICEVPEHTHDASCFGEAADGEPICGREEHVHTAECYDAPPASDGDRYTCGHIAHEHNENCFFSDGTLFCTLPEHIHTEICEIDPEAPAPEAEVITQEAEVATPETEIVMPEAEAVTQETEAEAQEAEFVNPVKKLLYRAPKVSYAGTLPEILENTNDANAWQIVSGDGVIDPNITYISDQNGALMRLRKNVYPTGIENEFYIRLKIEPVYYHDWATMFLGSGMLVCNNNAADSAIYEGHFGPGDNLPDVAAMLRGIGINLNGHYSLMVSQHTGRIPLQSEKKPLRDGPTAGLYETTQSGYDIYIKQIRLYTDAVNYMTINLPADDLIVWSLSQNSSSSFTIIYSPPNGNAVVKLSNITWNNVGRNDPSNPGWIAIPAEAYELLKEANRDSFDAMFAKALPEANTPVTDTMGDYIEFLGVEYVSSGTVWDDKAEHPENTTLYWTPGTPVRKTDSGFYEAVAGSADEYYYSGDYDLVYRIRLRTEKEGFVSSDPEVTPESIYPTNRSAELSYRTMPQNSPEYTGNGAFETPEVRGVLHVTHGTVLPETGGIGRGILIVSGVSVIIACLITGIYFRKKEKENRYEKNDVNASGTPDGIGNDSDGRSGR